MFRSKSAEFLSFAEVKSFSGNSESKCCRKLDNGWHWLPVQVDKAAAVAEAVPLLLPGSATTSGHSAAVVACLHSRPDTG